MGEIWNLIPTQRGFRTSAIFIVPRFLYRLSRGGEAVEASLALFVQTLQRRAELQTVTLEDIANRLQALLTLACESEADVAKVHETLRDLMRVFESLADKRPADLSASMRGLPGYDRRRYVLLCLACAVLERAEPVLTSLGFAFTLGTHHERRELVAVCRTLLGVGVLQRVVSDEDAFVHGASEQADALYDVQRRTLAGMLAALHGPSTWRPEDAPATLEARLHALVSEHVSDSDEGRRAALRHQLARHLLDDPVIYIDTLDAEARAYFVNQRGAMSARLCDAAGLVAEHRAEGLALADETGVLTDVAMPAEGTDAHATLLVAEFLASGLRQHKTDDVVTASPPVGYSDQDVIAFLRNAKS